MSLKKISVPILARVEGEGRLDLTVENNELKDLSFKIYEPPRFFEKFLENRNYYDVVDIVARICGICPVAYQMSAVHALENILGITTDEWVRDMRRLIYCGEWIESHALHIHFLALPDFLGFNNAIEMSTKYKPEVGRGIEIQHTGNNIIKMFGGRSVHPVGVKVGGFSHAPNKSEILTLLKELHVMQDKAYSLIKWIASIPRPNFNLNQHGDQREITFVSLHHPNEYPFNEGKIVSSKGLNISADEYENFFKEEQDQRSTSLYSYLQGEPYLVGPLARLNNNFRLLPPEVLNIINEIKLSLPSNNVFDSILARAIEIYYSILEATRILEKHHLPRSSGFQGLSDLKVGEAGAGGIGYGCTEAPRGLLWHKYELNEHGIVKAARIVPPTSQNQAIIQQDLHWSLSAYGLEHQEEKLRLMAEMVVRNYDPCISCSTHFLKLNMLKIKG